MCIQNRVLGCGAKVFTERSIAKQHSQRQRQLFFVARSNEKSVRALPDDFRNSLPSAADHRLAHAHRFQVDAAQPFILAGQSEYGTSAHGVGDLQPRLSSQKLHAIRNLKLLRQCFQRGAFWAVTNYLQFDLRKFGNMGRDGANQQVVTLDRNQVPDTEYEWVFRFVGSGVRCGRRRKQLRIDSVVHHRGSARWPRAFQDLLANVLADANHSPRRAINALRKSPAPLTRSPADLSGGEGVESVYRNYVRNAQFSA